MTSPLVLVVNDPRTPLERALGINPDLCRDRLETPTEAVRRKAKEWLLQRGINVIELPNGGWRVMPEYPIGATQEVKDRIDAACEDWMRRQFEKDHAR